MDVFCQATGEVLAGLDEVSDWSVLIDREPGLQRRLEGDDLDAALEAVADFTDLRSPCRAGHSSAVASLSARAAELCGLPVADGINLRRAALVHDLGFHGVPATILDKAAPLSASESERMRLHAYYTERMLARPPALARIGAVADALRAEVRGGRQAVDAVDAVLTVAGQRKGKRGGGPAGLTPREVEVLVLIARGASSRQVARALGISAKTAGTHIERIYAKTGASTRSTATLFAMQHGLLDSLEPFDL